MKDAKVLEKGLLFGVLLSLIYGLLAIETVGFTTELVMRIVGYAIIAVPVAVFFAYTESKLEDEEAITTGIASTLLVGVGASILAGALEPLGLMVTAVECIVQGFLAGIATYWLVERIG
ncbi:MAG: hypothetical protein DRP15_00055 [Candidatus Aenigmatarchaeota archaeon]|nr:MAG: hypothetical protein DRP15_00055 [Candidatus Aenigmarchaeota archaeon]